MTIWNVSPIYYEDDKVKYTVLPYSLKGVITIYLKYDKVTQLFKFLKNSKFTEKSARKYANKKNRQYDI